MAFKAKLHPPKFRPRFRPTSAIPLRALFGKTILASLLFLGLAGFCGIRSLHGFWAYASESDTASESWRAEFDNVCAKTEDAMTFSPEELADLIRRCDGLRPQIEKLDESRKKVYLERLRKCRGLYAYVLEAKKKEKK